MSKFQRKTREERECEIKKSALKVFSRKGYRNATMEDIIAETTLSKGGVYRYFSSPKEIMISIMQDKNNIDILFFEEIGESVNDKKELCNILANKAITKILSTSPEKNLYVMFIYEILYDKELESIFLEFEQQSINQLEKSFGNKIPLFKGEDKDKNRLFISRLINAMLLSQSIFSDKEIFNKHKEYIHKIFFEFFYDYID
ncbi:MAG: TetR/AcrR family transcriptional regulator [Vallitalea sp.]|jgi:AcrR family transcriptional regulator|nr:TetR/AcrR family transcriptional regulator [Vallitalea sp.]